MGLRNAIVTRTTRGTRDACRALWEELHTQRRHFASRRKAKRMRPLRDVKLNLGCGPCIKPGWINVDSWSAGADLQLDLRESLPFPDGCASFIHSEHFFEHLEYPFPARTFLLECCRILKLGGILSLGVPDTEWPMVCYATGERAYFDWVRKFDPSWCNTRMHNLNYHFRQGKEHKYAYDLETLKQILEETGFIQIERRCFDPELDSRARMVEWLPWKTAGLYVFAYKPGGPDNRNADSGKFSSVSS
jgi:predicted SAM-dependent methyltransferase